ncbi:Phage tail protein [compost metagenome]
MMTLLPPNTTPLERNLEQVGAQAVQLPVQLRSLWLPHSIPSHLLPHLAASWSVDHWNADWSEEQKRQAIGNSYFVHRRKGTVGAIRRAIEPTFRLNQITMWWQQSPQATPGTFRVDVSVTDVGISDGLYQELERQLADAKPVSRHMTHLTINLESVVPFYTGAACHQGEELTIQPLQAR